MKEFLSDNYIFIYCFLGLVTLASFILVAINSRHQRKRPCKIYYYPKDGLNIFNQLTDKFKDLKIQYDNRPITDNIIYIAGRFVSKGKDINSIDNRITIFAPDSCSWIDISMGENKNNAKITLINDSTALLSFDKFRRNSSFTISALLKTKEVLSQSDIEDIQFDIRFEHTINETDDVKIKDSYHTTRLFISELSNQLAGRLGLSFFDFSKRSNDIH